MRDFIATYLENKGYDVNDKAQGIIKECDDWYANRVIEDFHKRTTVHGTQFEFNRMGFAKRCCADDANLCEVAEVNGGKDVDQHSFLENILRKNQFLAMYRKQIENVSAKGTAACYVRLDNADIMADNTARGGDIRLNYVNAENFVPLTVENDEVIEAAFAGTNLIGGKVRTTVVDFIMDANGNYVSETNVFDEYGTKLPECTTVVQLGSVKPFAVLRNAEVNNIDNMLGYGYPKLYGAIAILKAVDLCFNVLFGDLDKADKLVLVNEILCKFDESGNPITPNDQIKKTFVMLGNVKLPDQKDLVQEINPEIRVDSITKAFELCLSLLSTMFGYGTKKYSFENGQIKTATEYAGERQDAMQELNKQRAEAESYIRDICKAILWFSNTFQGTNWNVDEEITVSFDDSYVTDRQSEMESKRADALSFREIPKLTIWYLMDRYNLSEDEAVKLYNEGNLEDTDDETED